MSGATPLRKLIRVVKVGGSLFDFDRLVPALRSWLAEQPPAVHVLVAGGGPWAEAIREADRRFKLGDQASHWLCVEALSVTAHLLANLLPESAFFEEFHALRDEVARLAAISDRAAPIIFSPVSFLRHDAANHPQPLPQDWTVTSDSIAARLAEQLNADQLILLKSSDAPSSDDLVDAFFPVATQKLAAVQIVNLRMSFSAQ